MPTPSQLEPKSTAVVTKFLRDAFSVSGLNTNMIFAESNIQLDSIEDPQARISHKSLLRMWDKATELSGDDQFGFKLAQTVPTVRFNTIGYLAMSAQNLREILTCTERYVPIFSDTAKVQLSETRDEATISIDLSGGFAPNRSHSEFWMVFYLRTLGQALGRDLPIQEVGFRHKGPSDQSAYRMFFRSNVRFGQEDNYIRIKREFLDRPCLDADPVVHGLLEKEASHQLRTLTETGITHKVKRMIFDAFPGREISLDEVADSLRLTPRTIQRRLTAEGTSYRMLVDQVRADFAMSTLRDSDVPISELAYQLGYLDLSSFYRAFKRWSGTTPIEYRAQNK